MRQRRSTLVLAAVVAGALMTVTGCGSTVHLDGATSPTTALDDLNGLGPATPGDPTPSTAAGPDLSGPAPSSPDASPLGSQTSQSTTPETPGDASEPAATSKPIKVGVVGVNFEAFGALFGVSSSVDPYAGYKRMFAAVNKQGGLGGRQISAIYTSIDGGASDANTEAQRVCAYFTQDNKVELIMSIGVINETFISCVGKRGIPQIDANLFGLDRTGMAASPTYFKPTALGMDRYAQSQLDVSAQLGILSSKDALGVVHEDCIQSNRVYKTTVVPTTKRLGVKLVEGSIDCYSGFSDLARVTAQIQSTVLRFHSAGVTKVMILSASEGFALVLFTKNASQQGWRPGYILSSNAFPYTNSDTSSAISYAADQLTKMTGVGWAPHIDVGPRAQTSAAQSAAEKHCLSLDPTLGGTASESGAVRENYRAFFLGECDVLTVARNLLKLTGGDASPSALAAVYSKAIAATVAASVPEGSLTTTGGTRTNVAKVTPFSYKASCRCFAPDGSPRLAS